MENQPQIVSEFLSPRSMESKQMAFVSCLLLLFVVLSLYSERGKNPTLIWVLGNSYQLMAQPNLRLSCTDFSWSFILQLNIELINHRWLEHVEIWCKQGEDNPFQEGFFLSFPSLLVSFPGSENGPRWNNRCHNVPTSKAEDGKQTPLQKKYFSVDMMSRCLYEKTGRFWMFHKMIWHDMTWYSYPFAPKITDWVFPWGHFYFVVPKGFGVVGRCARYEAMAESMAKIEDQGEDPDALKDLEQHWERFMVRVPCRGSVPKKKHINGSAAKITSDAVSTLENCILLILVLQVFFFSKENRYFVVGLKKTHPVYTVCVWLLYVQHQHFP